jgi:hypothetical protein
MASWEQVAKLALSLPQTSEREGRGDRQWRVAEKLFVWERPLRSKEVEELEALGKEVPDGPILGARVEHLGAKEALLAEDRGVYFTTPHFEGYAAILAQIERISDEELEELVTEAWLCRAPARLAKEHLESRSQVEATGGEAAQRERGGREAARSGRGSGSAARRRSEGSSA